MSNNIIRSTSLKFPYTDLLKKSEIDTNSITIKLYGSDIILYYRGVSTLISIISMQIYCEFLGTIFKDTIGGYFHFIIPHFSNKLTVYMPLIWPFRLNRINIKKVLGLIGVL